MSEELLFENFSPTNTDEEYRLSSKFFRSKAMSVAIIHQAVKSPPVDGVVKPMKRTGFRDGGADIAFALACSGHKVVTPVSLPSPALENDWTFPDTDQGIDEALTKGAEVIWANTVLFRGHPLEPVVRSAQAHMVGQAPEYVHLFGDKQLTNQLIRKMGCSTPESFLVVNDCFQEVPGLVPISKLCKSKISSLGFQFPLIVKPVRGLGTQGVRKIENLYELSEAVRELFNETVPINGTPCSRFGNALIVEEFLPGDEFSVTVMPPGRYQVMGREMELEYHWALTPVKRTRHFDGIAPGARICPFSSTSDLLSVEQAARPRFQNLLRQCETAAEQVCATAPVRIDARTGSDSVIKLFDVNMKADFTGPGRPERTGKESLSCLAARSIGWDYQDFISNVLANFT